METKLEEYGLSSKASVIILATVLNALVHYDVSPAPAELVSPAALFLERGKIVNIEPLPHGVVPQRIAHLSSGGKWRILNLPEQWLLLPSFVDCHVHLALDGFTGFKGLTKAVDSDDVKKRLRQAVGAGVLALRDGGDRYSTGLLAARSVNRGSYVNTMPELYPRIVATGEAIYRRGCYGSNLGRGVENLKEALSALESMQEAGARQAKVILTGVVSLQEGGRAGPQQFSAGELRAIVARARQLNLPVMVHANTDRAVRTAVEAGAHSVEHGYFLGLDTLKMMRDNGVAWVPTVVPLEIMLHGKRKKVLYGDGDTERFRFNEEAVRLAVQGQLKMIGEAHRLGVTLGLGTDAGAPGVSFTDGYRREMILYARAGLSPPQIAFIATENGARLLGLAQTMGRLSRGKKPPWICLEQSFLHSKESIHPPRAILKPRG